jgi:hypothetical protein
MKVAVCNLSIGSDYIKLVEHGHNSLKKYCEKNNYQFFYETEPLVTDRHVYWQKILLILKHIESCDVMVWIDSDIMILNDSIKLEDLIVEHMTDRDFLLCRDNGLLINTGVWFCRNTDFVKMILPKIYELKQFDNDRTPEQAAFTHFYDSNEYGLKDVSVVYPNNYQHIFNSSMYNLKSDSVLVHFLGIHEKIWMNMMMQKFCSHRLESESVDEYYRRITHIHNRYRIPIQNNRIAVLSLIVGEKYKEKMKYGTQSKIDFCKRYGYDFITDDTVYDTTRPIAWSKILLAKKYLPKYDYVWLVDADTVIMDTENYRIEQIITENLELDKDILISRDVSNEINTGSIFIKNTKFSMDLLDVVYGMTDCIDSQYWEQTAFNNFHNENCGLVYPKITVLPKEKQHLFNCAIGLLKHGMFMTHLYGPRNVDWVCKIMNDIYPKRKDDETEWEFICRRRWFEKSYAN